MLRQNTKRGLRQMLAAATIAFAMPVAAADAPAADGLTKVKAKRLDQAHVLTGVDFRPYTAIMLDPVDAAFATNWRRDYNRDVRDLSRQISDADAAKLLEEARSGLAKTFAATFAKAGYRIADRPGPDVLTVGATVYDIRVTAPDVPSAGRSRTYSRDAGSGALRLEARDSQTGKLLGRAIDGRTIGDTGRAMWWRSSVTNRADFEQAFKTWANAGVKALADLKAAAATNSH